MSVTKGKNLLGFQTRRLKSVQLEPGTAVSAPMRIPVSFLNGRCVEWNERLAPGTIMPRHRGSKAAPAHLDGQPAVVEMILYQKQIPARDALGHYLVRFSDGMVVLAHESELEVIR